MKKNSLLLLLGIFVSLTITAQQTVIFYPSLQYETGKGYTKQNVDFNASVESELWKRVGGVPTNEMIGADSIYRADLDKVMALKTAGYDKSVNLSYKTNTYAIIDAVDLSSYPSTNDFNVSFFNKAQYLKGENGAVLNVLISTNFSGDATTTTWSTVNDQLDTLDQPAGYDSNWVKSTLPLNAYKGEKITLAFQYVIENDGVLETAPDTDGADSVVTRPGQWVISDVKFTTSVAEGMDTIGTNQFNYKDDFEVINIISTNAQMWETSAAVRNNHITPEGINEYRAINVTAVYDEAIESTENPDSSVKSVSPVESWTVLKPFYCTNYKDITLSFWNKSQYKKGGDSELKIKISSNYTASESDSIAAVSAATWVDITDVFNLDESTPYDGEWIKSEAVIDADNNDSLVVAFVYTATATLSDVNGVNAAERAGTWRVCDVMVKGLAYVPSKIDHNKLETLKIFPNPSTGIINFTEIVNNVSIYTLQGKMVYNQAHNTTQIDASHLSKGIYFIKSTTLNNENATSRLIIK